MVQSVIVICLFCIIFVWIICESSYKNHSDSLLKAIDIIHTRINDLGKRVKDMWKVICNMQRNIQDIEKDVEEIKKKED